MSNNTSSRFYILMAGAMLMVSGAAFAEAGFGICDFADETLPSIICNGPGFLKHTVVKGDIKIAGKMEAHHIEATNIDVTGAVNINNSTVHGDMKVTGNLISNGVKYNKSIVVDGDDVVLRKSTVRGEMTIVSKTSKPRLKLVCSSIIAGAVTFDGLEGLVQVAGGSVVQGKVINGTIEFIEEKCP